MKALLKKLIGSRNDRLLKQYRRLVSKINQLEEGLKSLSDEELSAKTAEFKQRIEDGETLDKLLPEAFAVVREASGRTLGMRHFDVQMIGGMVLHQGKIAEMRTGEGKTLMSTLPVYLNALAGQGVHVVTVNDYLAKRDAALNAKLYNFLGLTVGVVYSGQSNEEKIQAYQSDITYGTNNEFGFDYLRDNMEYRLEDKRQRDLFYAIVDEVDSILIDEARTPLIISGQADDNTELYLKLNDVPELLVKMESEPKPDQPEPEGDFWLDEKSQQVYLSEQGHIHAEEILNKLGILPEGQSLYEPRNIALMHHLMVALRAHYLFFKDQHYVVQNNEVVIVDEFTGRLMSGRRWSDGLHQAVEAKEGVPIQYENQTLASITFQNYFRMYDKLSGMTGTADTEAYEFQTIYGLETVMVPTHRPMIRKDQNDHIYKSFEEKVQAIVNDVREAYERKQPVLVGTTSIESSELLSKILTEAKLPHDVLNAKQHEREAQIVAEAGKPGKITIATNMAGRGTDIVLGGSLSNALALLEQDESLSEDDKSTRRSQLQEEWKQLNQQVKDAGGLRIIGTERHESRRIDNQLRGRAGRQGDPGSSRFYLSLDDNMMRVFGDAKIQRLRSIMGHFGEEGQPIEARMVSRSIETAQRKVESHNFDIRKQLLDYDDVANEQRKVLYGMRNDVLSQESVNEMTHELVRDSVTTFIREFVPFESMEEQWDIPGLETSLLSEFKLEIDLQDQLHANEDMDEDDIVELILSKADNELDRKKGIVGTESWSQFERSVVLDRIDNHWRDHLAMLDHLRKGIHLRGYAQKDPKQEYKKEAFQLFSSMLDNIRDDVAKVLLTVQITSPEQVAEASEQVQQDHEAQMSGESIKYEGAPDTSEESERADKELAAGDTDDPQVVDEFSGGGIDVRIKEGRVPRNAPCPCGSGKKYKNCHGRLE